jgi:host factor-I protein
MATTPTNPGQTPQARPDPATRADALQDQFLAHLIGNQVDVLVFLVGGVKLQGRILGFDQYALLLEGYGVVQMVYKHAISAVSPHTAVQLWQRDPKGPDGPDGDGNGPRPSGPRGPRVIRRSRFGPPGKRVA